jgi:predicted alpha-1,2-mannosidase
MGSGGYSFAYGSAFPGASAPSGMMRVGPDTSGPLGTLSFQHFSGYWDEDDTILAFSHMHLHGTGATDYGVLAVMPTLAFDPTKLRAEDLASTFAKSSEIATPGSYTVTLDNGPILCAFTARPHSAHEQFTFPKGAASGTLQLDLARHLTGSVVASQLNVGSDLQSVTGSLTTTGGMSGGFTLYFAARFSQPFSAQHLFSDASAPNNGLTASGTNVGAAFDFALSNQPVGMQIALSLVSIAGAQANLAAELTSWDFSSNQQAAQADWRAQLDTARVYGGSDSELATFYSALHHAFVMPGVYSDVDGHYQYRSTTAQTAGTSFVNDLSLWDTYRTLNPLYDLLAPTLALNVVSSLSAMAQVDGQFPKWPLAASDSGTMIGASSEIVLADAYVKGVQSFDAQSAYAMLRAAALDPDPSIQRGGRDDSLEYMTLGYVPADLHQGSVSLTTEYATDDTALANLAEALGHADDAAALRARALGYRKLFDPASGFLRAHDASGALHINADETFSPSSWTDYVEGDARQYSWAPIHDPAGYSLFFGSAAGAATALSSFFASSQQEYANDLAAAGDDDGPDELAQARNLPLQFYWAGNEIDLNATLQFALQGRPDLTAQWVAWARATFFSSAPNGLPGNDDGGTMSAWYVFSALGFFPVSGTPNYIIATPLFPRVDLSVPGGVFSIVASGVSQANIYVQSAQLNGVALTTAQFSHSDLKAGGSLSLKMGPNPSAWGQ